MPDDECRPASPATEVTTRLAPAYRSFLAAQPHLAPKASAE